MWVLRTNFVSSARTASAHNFWATSPVQESLLKCWGGGRGERLISVHWEEKKWHGLSHNRMLLTTMKFEVVASTMFSLPHCLGFLMSIIDLESKYFKAVGLGLKTEKYLKMVKLSFLLLAREISLSNEERTETSENSVFEEARNVWKSRPENRLFLKGWG